MRLPGPIGGCVRESSQRILERFRRPEMRAGDVVHFWDLGDAVQWEGGAIRGEEAREGLRALVEDGFVEEYHTGLGLTEKGYEFLRGNPGSRARNE